MRTFIKTSLAVAALSTAVFFYACQKNADGSPELTSASARKTKMDPVQIGLGTTTQSSINLVITAGATGAPAGFSVQWMTVADFTANGNQWFESNDGRLCKASFSGNANISRYNLGAGQSVTVNIGETLFDNGASVSNGANCDPAIVLSSCYDCIRALVCGTEYVFRAFAHANSQLQRSDWSSRNGSTLACLSGPGCTYTQGYWKTHGPMPTGNNGYEWPQSVKDNGLVLGSVSYTPQQLLAIFGQPSQGNGLTILAHQLIAAKLNVANGASSNFMINGKTVSQAIAEADALIGSLVVPPVGNGSLAPNLVSALNEILTTFNEGTTEVPHCN